jgi:hypothetical protein
MPPEAADDSIIDVTGLFFRLQEAMRKEIADIQATASSAPPANPLYTYQDYEPPSLGKIYREKLGLTPRQVSWVDRFPLPSNSFLDTIEAGREATVRLYVAVLPLLELQLKTEGSTLAQTVKVLDDRAKFFRYRAATSWYYTSPQGSKTGADIYLAIFRVCENAVRAHLGHKRKMANVFTGSLADLAPEFWELLGQRVQELLPGLLALIPPPDHDTELQLNEQNTGRWKSELEQLKTTDPNFVTALAELAERNARNPAVGALYQEATKRLATTHREEALRYHLRYLHSVKARFAEGKALAKGLQKQLFPLPGQAERFQVIVHELAFYKKLDEALAKVSGVYIEPRRKIELDSHAIHAARRQHAGTVELLNEYLQDDEPMPQKAPITPKKPAKAAAAKAVSKATTSLKTTAPKKSPVTPATAGTFAPNLALSDMQQALLHLFAAHQLALPRMEVEAFAKQHGTLRNQLIDGLNEACAELLDDVLIEESDDGYTIYEPYYQQLIS